MFDTREARLQDANNRQNSIPVQDRELEEMWQEKQKSIIRQTTEAYQWALSNGIAKEQARAVLPEGNTMSRMYMTGNLRSWLHYIQVRTDPSTQLEHRIVAEQCKQALMKDFPNILSVLDN